MESETDKDITDMDLSECITKIKIMELKLDIMIQKNNERTDKLAELAIDWIN